MPALRFSIVLSIIHIMREHSDNGDAIPRRIIGFHQDDEHHWVADLECGHTQHVRHDPPWQVREWVTTAEGRASHLGTTLRCVKCVAACSPGRSDQERSRTK
jgi:hypothetical protein